MNWVPDNVIAALQGSHQLGVFLRVATDPELHLWFGVNDMPIGFDSIDPSGTVYLGGGRLQGIPTLEILVNGTSDSVEFTVTGIDPDTGSKMIDSLPAVRGADVHVGITTLDDYFQPMSKVIPLWTGTASHIGESSPAVQSGQSASLTLSLAVASGNDTRSRPSRSLWSSAHQGTSDFDSPRALKKTPAQIAAEKAENIANGQPNKKIDPIVRNPDGSAVSDLTITPGDPPARVLNGVPLYRDKFCDGTARLARGVQPAWPRYN